MQLQDATFDTAGQYDCEVTVPSLPGLLTSGSVHIIVQGEEEHIKCCWTQQKLKKHLVQIVTGSVPPGAPQMKDAEREIELTEKVGGWVNLSCEVRGYPRPIITWSITGSQVTLISSQPSAHVTLSCGLMLLSCLCVCVCVCVVVSELAWGC